MFGLRNQLKLLLMATLTLEPDELLPHRNTPPGGEAEGPFPLFWCGEERQLLIRTVEFRNHNYVYFAREVGDEAVGNWLLCEREKLTPVRDWPGNSRTRNIPKHFGPLGWTLARLFVVSNAELEQPFSLLLSDDGVGACLDKGLRLSARFDFDLPFEVVEFDRSKTRQYWQRELADPDSDIHFAANFAALRATTRFDLIWGEHRSELIQIIEWVLKCEPRLWEYGGGGWFSWIGFVSILRVFANILSGRKLRFWLQRSLRPLPKPTRLNHYSGGEWHWELRPGNPDFSYLFCPDTDNFEDFIVNSPFIYAMGRFLVETYILQLTQPLRDKHRCVRDFLESEPVWIQHFSQTPTAHEQIEAALNLRDWLRKNHAPAELLALLPS